MRFATFVGGMVLGVLGGCGGGGDGGSSMSAPGQDPTLIGARSVPGMRVTVRTGSNADTYHIQIDGGPAAGVAAWIATDVDADPAPVPASAVATTAGLWSVTLPRNAAAGSSYVWVRVVDATGNSSVVGRDFILRP